jgi:hypothetical protein
VPDKLILTDIAASTPGVVPSEEDGVWLLDREVKIWMNLEGREQIKLTLAKGFATNFRSGWDGINAIIPKATLGKGLGYTAAILAHDAAYTPPHPYSKEIADALLLQEMKNSGMGKFKLWLVRKSLEWFGGRAWKEPLEGVYAQNAEKIEWRLPNGFA